MKNIRTWLRTLDVGDWLALFALMGSTIFILFHLAAGAWSDVIGSLQPEIQFQNKPDYDLIAQRSMSAAAWWMVGVSLLSTGVAAAGLVLLLRNLREAQRTADNGLAAVQAYLSVDLVKVFMERDDLVVLYKYTNSGISPARDVAVTALVLCREQRNDGRVSIVTQHEITKSRSDCPAGSKRAGKTRFPVDLVYSAMGEPNEYVLIEVTLTLSYLDVFKRLHPIEVRYGRVLHFMDFGTRDAPKSLYRDVGRGIGWGT